MSVFKWDATGGVQVVGDRFWVYWAVTIPLIFATFLACILWLRYRIEKKPVKGHKEWTGATSAVRWKPRWKRGGKTHHDDAWRHFSRRRI